MVAAVGFNLMTTLLLLDPPPPRLVPPHPRGRHLLGDPDQQPGAPVKGGQGFKRLRLWGSIS